MIKYALLQHHFDARELQGEVHRLQQARWKPHYNESHYQGNWSTLPLRSINGDIENGVSIQNTALQQNMAYKNTTLLAGCSYLQSVIDFFECEKMSVRLMKLEPGAVIKEHTDYAMNYEEGEARFHIPVLTNDGVEFFITDERLPLREGECWYLNLSLKHRVNNFGDTNRIHLVIDCKVNDWVTNLLKDHSKLLQDIEIKEETARHSPSDKIKIIRELRMMNTPASIELADKLEMEDG